jgi:hypothetical protein
MTFLGGAEMLPFFVSCEFLRPEQSPTAEQCLSRVPKRSGGVGGYDWE